MKCVFAVVAVLALASCSPSVEEAAKAKAAALLRDPSSAQFRNVKAGSMFVCGEINGKNGFGAYTGFVRFHATKDSAEIDPQSRSPVYQGGPSPSEMFDTSYKIICE